MNESNIHRSKTTSVILELFIYGLIIFINIFIFIFQFLFSI